MIPLHFLKADLNAFRLGAATIVLLVALATALGVAITVQERSLRLGSARAADRFDLLVGAPGSETQLVLSSVFLQPSPLPLLRGDVLKELSENPKVKWAAPIGLGDSFEGYPVIGTTAVVFGADGITRLAEGHAFTHRKEAVIGASVKLALGDSFKPTHGLPGAGGHTHGEIEYTITGRAAPTGTAWDRAILVPIETVWHIHGLEERHDHAHTDTDHAHHDHTHADEDHAHDEADETSEEGNLTLGPPWSRVPPGVPAIAVKVKSLGDAYALRQKYRQGTSLALFPAEVMTRLYATLGDARFILSVLAVAVQILIGIAIALISVIHLAQKRRQIAALRAFGAPRLAIAATIWTETMLLIGVGIAIGIVLGLLAARGIASIVTADTGLALPVSLTGTDLLLALVLFAIAGIVALAPALLAYRQPIAPTLRAASL